MRMCRGMGAYLVVAVKTSQVCYATASTYGGIVFKEVFNTLSIVSVMILVINVGFDGEIPRKGFLRVQCRPL